MEGSREQWWKKRERKKNGKRENKWRIPSERLIQVEASRGSNSREIYINGKGVEREKEREMKKGGIHL